MSSPSHAHAHDSQTPQCGHGPPARRSWAWTGTAAQWIFLFGAVGLLLLYAHSSGETREALGDMFTIFVSIVLEAIPFLLLGSLLGGFIETFVSRDRITAILERRRYSVVFVAAALGLIFPVCECAIVPVVRRLVRKGIPFSAAIAYLLAGPLFNPLVAASTAVAYEGEWKIVALRMGLGYGAAVIVALVMGRLFSGSEGVLPHALSEEGGACAHGCDHPHHDHGPRGLGAKLHDALAHGADDFLEVGRFLIMGAFLAGILQGLVSESSLLGMVMNNPVAAIGLMMVLAVVLNLCSEADAFVAASLRSIIPLPGQMAFMVLGPMLDLKLIFMYFSVFRKRTIVALSLATTAVVFGMMLILELFL